MYKILKLPEDFNKNHLRHAQTQRIEYDRLTHSQRESEEVGRLNPSSEPDT